MNTPKRIQRRRTKGWRMPEGAIYVGRPTRWGNPFPPDGPESLGLDLSLEIYRNAVHGIWDPTPLQHLGDQPYTRLYTAHTHWRARLGSGHPQEAVTAELRGRDLVCWCPLEDEHGNRFPCHADVLLELANA